jgi:hypothetical protein
MWRSYFTDVYIHKINITLTEFQQIRQKLLFDQLDKYPNHGSHTIARILYKENPGFFTDFENARCYIRYYRGASGLSNRKRLKIKKYAR